MTALEQAMRVYTQERCARTFNEDLISHLMHGFVFSTPEYFIMGRPVVSTEDRAEIVNPEVTWPRERCDCWHIHLMAGDTRPAWSIMPWPLPLFSFERRNDLRFYPVERIKRLSGVHLNTP
jgi:hypothetical protein